MGDFKFRFTVFTPCYNSEKFLERVYKSVSLQTFRNFEWLVINDASTDNTLELIKKYQSKANFPMRFINNSENKMVYHNFNIAFEEAQGELMVFAGHDDEFDKDTLEFFDEVWTKYGSKNISGIKCFCRDQHGNIIGNFFEKDLFVSNYHTMFTKFIYGPKEKFGATRVDLLRKFKFEVEQNKTSESFLWSNLAMEYDSIFSNKVLRTYYREQGNAQALTKRSRESVSYENYLYYLDFINIYTIKVPGSLTIKLKFHAALILQGLISKFSLLEIINSITNVKSKLLVLLFFPLVWVMYRISFSEAIKS